MFITKILFVFAFLVILNESDNASTTKGDSLNISDRRLVIDCDAGADDGGAILQAIEGQARGFSPQLIAITCVDGITSIDNVVKNVGRLLKLANRTDIKYYRGASKPIYGPRVKKFYPFGLDGFGDVPYDASNDPLPQREFAAVALVKLVNKYRKRLDVIAIGPLTNFALALRIDPKLFSKIGRFYFAGGTTGDQCQTYPDLNFAVYADPRAFNIVAKNTHASNSLLFPFDISEHSPFILPPPGESTHVVDPLTLFFFTTGHYFLFIYKPRFTAVLPPFAVMCYIYPPIIEASEDSYVVASEDKDTRGALIVNGSPKKKFNFNVITAINYPLFNSSHLALFRGLALDDCECLPSNTAQSENTNGIVIDDAMAAHY